MQFRELFFHKKIFPIYNLFKGEKDMSLESLMTKAGKVIPNRFLLTRVLVKRVRQLNSGYKPKVEVKEKTPSMEIALMEISEGKIELAGINEPEIQT